jgi:RNA polymerase sigma-70 factor (ECF subfamily)
MPIDDSIIEGCIAGKRSAQSALYKAYSAVMLSICMRYARSRDEAEDILQEAFLKIFRNIGTYRREGSFEGWMKRIIINHALNCFRKNRKMPFIEDIDNVNETQIVEAEDPMPLDVPVPANTLIHLIRQLPPGYRMVFNMYVFEEYSHKEIAEMLNFSESTSKTQLLKARKMLRKKLFDMNLVINTEQVDE